MKELRVGIFGLGRGGEADLDLLETELAQGLEEAQLFGKVHRGDQRLVAVAQVDRAPDGRLFNGVLEHPVHRDALGHKILLFVLGTVLHNVFLSSFVLASRNKKRPFYATAQNFA